jgi:hypothetical protein
MLMSVRKRGLEAKFVYPSPAPAAYDNQTEIDPNVIAVQLRHTQNDNREFVLNMLITKEYAQKLGLMAGDKVKLKIVKDG